MKKLLMLLSIILVAAVALFAFTGSIKKKEVAIQTLLDETMQFPGMISGELCS